MIGQHRLTLCYLFIIWTQLDIAISDSNFKFLGIGYNLLTGNPDGGTLETGGVDPGLLFTRKIFDLSHPLAVEAEGRQSCVQEEDTSIFYGAKSYQEKLKVDVSFGGSAIAGIVNFAFSLSPRFEQAKDETTLQHKVFQDNQITCNLGRQRFAEELAHAYSFSITENFAASVCALPAVYDKTPYMEFLDSWGTHVTVQVELGTRNISRRESSLAEFVDHVSKTSGVDVSAGGSYMGFGASLKVDYENFKTSSSFDLTFGSYSYTLVTGSPTLPEPIGLKLVTIDTALNSLYWQSDSTWSSHDLCTTSYVSGMSQIQTNVLTALSEYAAYKMASEPTDPDLKIPVMWPKGTYGLYKPTAGCPADNVTWFEGYRYQDCENWFTDNEFSGDFHFSGMFDKKADIRTEFCIKGDEQGSEFDLSWPKGDYCIAKYGDCPADFQEGWLWWDDENDSSVDENSLSGGILPDGEYGGDTKIFYCCRSDSLPTEAINLPNDKPFYLLRHTRTCQDVVGMHVVDESIYWDEEFHLFPSGNTKAGGSHPFDDGNHDNHRIHFCYYTPADGGDVIVG